MGNNYALKGNICYSHSKDNICIHENSYVICENGICGGIYSVLPDKYERIECIDYGDKLIIPGLVDLHVHAPQYAFRGLGMDLELLDWLEKNAFVEEQKYSDLDYARKAYRIFAEDLARSATTRACVFGTIHTEATLLLMEMLEKTGIKAYVGRVNMDRNCPDGLCETDAKKAAEDTERWIQRCREFKNIKPILTPRFIPACTDELMERLAMLQSKYGLAVQSHLSENKEEVLWVRELCPDAACYGDAYDRYGMFGKEYPAIMAHCVYSGREETELMRGRQLYAAHCPESNANLSSGIAPVRTFLDKGVKVGLGTDIAAGSGLSMFRTMGLAVQCSKLKWRIEDETLVPLKFSEVFYMATRGGGEFFGNVGSFEKGFEFDALVIDDGNMKTPRKLTVIERLERLVYLAEEQNIAAKFISGQKIRENIK